MERRSKAAGIEERRLSEIERSGDATKKESRQIAASLGIPDYALTIPHLPIKPLPQDFRTKGNVSPTYGLRGLQAIYEMQSLADFAAMLGEKLQITPTFEQYVTDSFGVLSPDKPQKVVDALKSLTNYHFEEITEDTSAPELFSAFRLAIEARNVLIVCERLINEAYRGFCLSGMKFPIIYINTYKQSHRIRNFTIIHELVHLLVGRPGVVDPFNTRSGIERVCNSITAQFLLPAKEFKAFAIELRRKSPKDWVDSVSANLPFSKFFVALRMQEVFEEKRFVNEWLSTLPRKIHLVETEGDFNSYDLTDQDLISIDEFEVSEDKDGLEGELFSPRQTAASYQVNRLGGAVIGLVESALSAQLISKYDVYDQLKVKTTVIDNAAKSARQKRSRVRKLR